MTSKQEKWTAPVVRKTFLEFFEGKGHTVGRWRGRLFLVKQKVSGKTSIAWGSSIGD
jgi:hypothetical protein